MPIDTTLPGDLSVMDTVGMGEGEPIWDRMAKIIRSRRLDVRQLMAGFDRSKKGFFDLATLRRAFSNAFSNQWTELAMTQAEFAEVTEPYLTRVPQNNGEPTSLVQWRQLAQDLQVRRGRGPRRGQSRRKMVRCPRAGGSRVSAAWRQSGVSQTAS